jgi:hypothetical protein
VVFGVRPVRFTFSPTVPVKGLVDAPTGVPPDGDPESRKVHEVDGPPYPYSPLSVTLPLRVAEVGLIEVADDVVALGAIAAEVKDRTPPATSPSGLNPRRKK